jgi:hypothetical protein
MRKRKTARGVVTTPRQLDKLIEEATVDCYNEEEQAHGFFTMIEENLVLPFSTRVLGIEVSAIAIEMDDSSVGITSPQIRVTFGAVTKWATCSLPTTTCYFTVAGSPRCRGSLLLWFPSSADKTAIATRHYSHTSQISRASRGNSENAFPESNRARHHPRGWRDDGRTPVRSARRSIRRSATSARAAKWRVHVLRRRAGGERLQGGVREVWRQSARRGKLPLCAEMCSTKSLLAVDGDIIAQIYKERVSRRGYGSGAWGWQTAYRETIGS